MTFDSGVTKKNIFVVRRLIRWFEKSGDSLVGEVPLDDVDLLMLHKLFSISSDNPMYDCYPIKTKRQIKYIQKAARHSIEHWSYDYFLECDRISHLSQIRHIGGD